jgi:hypothetical protein
MEDLIYKIAPQETPFLNLYTSAERTVMRFAGPSKRVDKWFRRRANKRRKPIYHEWVTDTLST